MTHILTTAFIAILAITSVAADSKDRIPLALYVVGSKDEPATRPYTFTGALDEREYSGFYRPQAVVTIGDIDGLSITSVERGAAPFPAFSFHFTKGGAAKLQAVLKQTPDAVCALIIDGHCYSTVPPETLQSVLSSNRVLNIIVRAAYSDATHHLMELVVEKLTPKLAKP